MLFAPTMSLIVVEVHYTQTFTDISRLEPTGKTPNYTQIKGTASSALLLKSLVRFLYSRQVPPVRSIFTLFQTFCDPEQLISGLST